MCGKAPKPQQPAAAPAPPIEPPQAPIVNPVEASDKSLIGGKRKGKSSLLIDLNTQVPS